MRATPCTEVIGMAKVDSPMRTRMACVTARVNGRRSTKVVPSPWRRLDRQRTAELLDLVGHHVHAHAATGELGDGAGGGEACLGDQRKQLVVAEARFRTNQATLDRALANRLAIQAAPVVADAHHHLGGFARHADAHGAFFRLARLATVFRRLDTVRNRVTQHVLERRLDAVEQVAIHFAVRAFHVQLGALAFFLRGLAQRTAQVRHHGVERQHARAQQAFLQFRTDARLLDQQRFGLTGEFVEHVLDRHQVRHRLGQCTRILLQLREAVEFERIEHADARFAVLALEARDDLRFRFDFQHAQLAAQTCDGLLEFDQVEAIGRNLLLQARTVDRNFAGVVDEVVEQVGAYADLFLRGACGFFLLQVFVGKQRGQIHSLMSWRLCVRWCLRLNDGLGDSRFLRAFDAAK